MENNRAHKIFVGCVTAIMAATLAGCFYLLYILQT
jgi:hypothetical protein